MQSDGNFVLYGNSATSGRSNAIWSSSSSGNNNAIIAIESDGELVLRNSSLSQILWRSEFDGLNYMPLIQLIDQGYLVIYNNNSNIARAYPIDVIEKYLIDVHWAGSPWVLFSDYRPGAVYWAKWSDLNQDVNISTLPNDGTVSDFIRFYGIRKDKDDSNWGIIESNIIHPLGYKQTVTNGVKPDNKSDSNRNWNRTSDAKTFYDNQNRYASCPKIEYPTQIPGYDRISQVTKKDPTIGSDTSKFLISIRGTSMFDQAFILYKIKSRDINYANDIIQNNKSLIYNIIKNNGTITNFNNNLKVPLDYISNNILNIGVDKWSFSYQSWLLTKYLSNYTQQTGCISSFTNKSTFLNKIHKALPFSTNGKLIEKFANVQECNLNEITTDKNCKGTIYNSYIKYLNNMEKYCSNNILDPKCTDYIEKKFISIKDPSKEYKPYKDNKSNLLKQQESNCEIENNYINERCISINSKRPEILQKQIKTLDKKSEIYKNLESKYGDVFLFELCMANDNIINKDNITNCSNLMENNTYSQQLKNKKLEVCEKILIY